MTRPTDGFRPETLVAIDAVERALELARHRVGGADITATQVPGEEPFRRPAPEATDGREGLDHLVVRVAGEGVEVQLARGDPTGETNDVLGLAGGELHAAQLAHGRASESRCARSVCATSGGSTRTISASSRGSTPDARSSFVAP